MGITHQGVKHILHNISVLMEGQKTSYAILQISHRLEKGLCIRNPRAGWGYDKAEYLVDLISKEEKQAMPDSMAIEIGRAVLDAYIKAKEITKDDMEKLEVLKSRVDKKNAIKTERGGVIRLTRHDMIQNESVENLFLTRHSVRDFSSIPVDPEKLEHAVRLALCAPSACNRQASQIYVISGEDRIRAGSSNEYNADKYLIITGNMRAFLLDELNDWIVSTSIFCGFLSLALHSQGIGSCIFRKDIIQESKYNDNIRSMCNIPDDEQIILEMAIGNYKDEFDVPVSCRREAASILHYLK